MTKIKLFIKKYALILTLVPVIAMMIFVFVMSAATAVESSGMSSPITEQIIKVLVPDFKSMSAPEQQQIVENTTIIVRKTAHFCEFALLGALIMLHISTLAQRIKVWHPPIISVGIGVLYAISDEIHQIFVPGRGGAVIDVLIDSAGVTFGVFIVWLIVRAIMKKMSLNVIAK